MAVPGEPGPQAIFRCLQSIFRCRESIFNVIFRSIPSFTGRLRLMYICVVIYIEFGLVYIQSNLETLYTLIYSGFYFQMLQPERREGYFQIDIRLIFRPSQSIFRRSESIFRLIFRIFGYFYFQIAFTFRLQAALYVHKCGVCSVCQLYGVNVSATFTSDRLDY